MKKQILTYCLPCKKGKLTPRESKYPASLVRINRDCDDHWNNKSVETYLDKHGREIDPKTGKPV